MSHRPRLRGFVLLLALLGVQLTTLGAALAGGPSCLCDEQMCVHHPGKSRSHDHDRSSGPDHAGQRVDTPAAEHCAHAAAVGPKDCSMRGCDHQGDDSLPATPLASLPQPTTFALPEIVSALPSFTVASLLDRSSNVEPPPPRSPAV